MAVRWGRSRKWSQRSEISGVRDVGVEVEEVDGLVEDCADEGGEGC